MKFNRKGIILAGGFGTRLHPLTQVMSKQLLPIYDKPMIFYPLSNLIMSNIKDILIISSPGHLNFYKKLLGNGKKYGVNFTYKIQKYPNGIAEGILIAEKFLNGSDMCLILGDNIYFGKNIDKKFLAASMSKKQSIFIKKVKDPNKYGVIKFKKKTPVLIVEKPKKYVSNYAVTGIYYLSNHAIELTKRLKPSKRKELEITDLNNILLENDSLFVNRLDSHHYWYDAGNHEDYLDASIMVRNYEKRSNKIVGSLEYEAFKKEILKKEDLFNNIKFNNQYYQKLYKKIK
tara:strand:- start:3778 stop:4641 length:864 start_codon:yes stop_codon:yes gene_type:complete